MSDANDSGGSLPIEDDVLVAGPPPLTRSMISDLVAFLEWILQVRLPPTTAQLFETVVINHWRERRVGDMATLERWLITWKDLSTQPPETHDLARESYQGSFVASLRAEADELSRALVGLYDMENAPIAEGSPPLTHEASNASLDLLDFMSAVVNGVDSIDNETPAGREAWTSHLARCFPALPPEIQAWIGEAPMTLAALKAYWGHMSDYERAAHRAMWARELPSLFETVGGALDAEAPGSTADPGSTATSDMPTERTPSGALDDLIRAQEAEEEELMKTDPVLAVEKQMANQQMRMTMINDMSKMMHDTSTIIINNMLPDSTYRYTYE